MLIFINDEFRWITESIVVKLIENIHPHLRGDAFRDIFVKEENDKDATSEIKDARALAALQRINTDVSLAPGERTCWAYLRGNYKPK